MENTPEASNKWGSDLAEKFFRTSTINGPGWNSFNPDGTFTIGLMRHAIPTQWQSESSEFHLSEQFIDKVREISGCPTFDIILTYGGNTAFLHRTEIHQVGTVIDAILSLGVDIWLQHCFRVVYYAKDYPEIRYSRLQTEKKIVHEMQLMVQDEIARMADRGILPGAGEDGSYIRRQALDGLVDGYLIPIRQLAEWNYLSEESREFVRKTCKELGKNPWEGETPFWEWPMFAPMKGEIETLFV
jgi:hypothetical protein